MFGLLDDLDALKKAQAQLADPNATDAAALLGALRTVLSAVLGMEIASLQQDQAEQNAAAQPTSPDSGNGGPPPPQAPSA